MRIIITMLAFINNALFLVNVMVAGLTLAHGLYGLASVSALAALLHKLIADSILRTRDAEFPPSKHDAPK